MKKIVLAIVALLTYATTATAEVNTSAPDPFHDWFTYYYLQKDNKNVPEFLKWVQQSGTLEKHPDAIGSLEGFLSVVFADNPGQVDAWNHTTTYTGVTQKAVDYAVKPPVAPDTVTIKNASDLDMVWGSFYASGNEIYLKKVVDALDPKSDLGNDAKIAEATRTAAAVSLGTNMTQHESVDRFLQKESTSRTDAVGNELKKIVANVTDQRNAHALPNHDGDFSAIVFITDPAVAGKELARASGDILHFKDMPYVKIGDKRTAVIIFAGMQLTPDYMADVTYDIQLVDPAGKIYTDKKDLLGIKEKVATRFRIFNNQAAVFMSFDRKDTPGIYKVYVTLKDNVGKKSIPLIAKLAFKKKGK